MTGPHRVSFDDVISVRSWVRSGRSVRKPASLKNQQQVARLGGAQEAPTSSRIILVIEEWN